MVVNTSKGMVTNLQLAQKGKSPIIIKNGQESKIELHHSNQNALGPLFELSNVTHRSFTNTNALHPYKNEGTGLNPYNPVNRTIFDKDRVKYWKERAKEIQKQLNLK